MSDILQPASADQAQIAQVAGGHPAARTLDEEAKFFAQDTLGYFGGSNRAMHRLLPAKLASLQLAALRWRFTELRDRIPVLTQMADAQGIAHIVGLDDAVPILFQHTVYKSYPRKLLDEGRMDALSRWLDRLTTRDLASISFADCDNLDSWIEALEVRANLVIAHTSGTSGTLSFFPRTRHEYETYIRIVRSSHLNPDDREEDGEGFHIIWPNFRTGSSGILRMMDFQVQIIAGSEERFHALYPGRMSSELVLLAARLQGAAARGETIELNQRMQKRRAEFEAMQATMKEAVPRFLEKTLEELRGKRVYFGGTWNMLHNLASQGLADGKRNVLGPGSVVYSGGGAKGQTIPPDWEEKVKEFTGVPSILHVYGMTEVLAMNCMCSEGRYHIEPWVIIFVLDPDSGAPLPRHGRHTGRAAFFDLHAESYWGGFISGDEVTVDWSPCLCGRTTPGIDRRIERYSEKRGGDDKISCAASDQAHTRALDFLNQNLG